MQSLISNIFIEIVKNIFVHATVVKLDLVHYYAFYALSYYDF